MDFIKKVIKGIVGFWLSRIRFLRLSARRRREPPNARAVFVQDGLWRRAYSQARLV